MYRGVDDHFLEHPCASEQKRDNGPAQGQLFFVGQGSISFIGVVILREYRLLSGFRLGRLFQVAKIEYDFI